MTPIKFAVVSAALSAGFATTATAAPSGALAPVPSAAITPTLVVNNGYGQTRYGIYGHRHRYTSRRSYGTGYHGRGTATGGPVGGLPSRN